MVFPTPPSRLFLLRENIVKRNRFSPKWARPDPKECHFYLCFTTVPETTVPEAAVPDHGPPSARFAESGLIPKDNALFFNRRAPECHFLLRFTTTRRSRFSVRPRNSFGHLHSVCIKTHQTGLRNVIFTCVLPLFLRPRTTERPRARDPMKTNLKSPFWDRPDPGRI